MFSFSRREVKFVEIILFGPTASAKVNNISAFVLFLAAFLISSIFNSIRMWWVLVNAKMNLYEIAAAYTIAIFCLVYFLLLGFLTKSQQSTETFFLHAL